MTSTGPRVRTASAPHHHLSLSSPTLVFKIISLDRTCRVTQQLQKKKD
uniref:Uncharacterized protein n=1 Tax=Rhizophora mucronata TaxID=61149 RepID=A0A2P2QA97_RHIMU